MKFSVKLKKSVVVKTLVLLVIGLAVGFVIGQSTYTLNTSAAWHPLQQISAGSSGGSLFSVDRNNNFQIDSADNSDKTRNIDVDLNGDGVVDKASEADTITGSIPNYDEGCVASVSAGPDSLTGYGALNLKKSRDLTAPNICNDGDGCTYSVISYNAPSAPVGMKSTPGGSIKFYQFGVPYAAGSNTWIDESGSTGTNGDGVSTLISSMGGATTVLQILDDAPSGTPGGEGIADQITIRDMSNSLSFAVMFCD